LKRSPVNKINRTRKRKSRESLFAALFVAAACLFPLSGCGEGAKPPAQQQKAEVVKQAPEKKPVAVAAAEVKKAPPEPAGYHYDPMGKIDPFVPLVREVEGMDAQVLDDEGPLTPLQRYALAELKLVAVIVAGDQSKAMVEDGKGDGYILSRGTLVGNKHGEVTEIKQNEVVIVEKEINPSSGGIIQKKVSLVLHTSEEEEL
jgi:type IV pilus assembly protein PilP